MYPGVWKRGDDYDAVKAMFGRDDGQRMDADYKLDEKLDALKLDGGCENKDDGEEGQLCVVCTTTSDDPLMTKLENQEANRQAAAAAAAVEAEMDSGDEMIGPLCVTCMGLCDQCLLIKRENYKAGDMVD